MSSQRKVKVPEMWGLERLQGLSHFRFFLEAGRVWPHIVGRALYAARSDPAAFGGSHRDSHGTYKTVMAYLRQSIAYTKQSLYI